MEKCVWIGTPPPPAALDYLKQHGVDVVRFVHNMSEVGDVRYVATYDPSIIKTLVEHFPRRTLFAVMRFLSLFDREEAIRKVEEDRYKRALACLHAKCVVLEFTNSFYRFGKRLHEIQPF